MGFPCRSTRTGTKCKAEKEGHHTDFSLALSKLGVEIIYAKTPQAKGRVERENRTLQDRLVKEMRRKNISTIAQANPFLEEEFLDELNAKFSKTEELRDVHRPLKGYMSKIFFVFSKNASCATITRFSSKTVLFSF